MALELSARIGGPRGSPALQKRPAPVAKVVALARRSTDWDACGCCIARQRCCRPRAMSWLDGAWIRGDGPGTSLVGVVLERALACASRSGEERAAAPAKPERIHGRRVHRRRVERARRLHLTAARGSSQGAPSHPADHGASRATLDDESRLAPDRSFTPALFTVGEGSSVPSLRNGRRGVGRGGRLLTVRRAVAVPVR